MKKIILITGGARSGKSRYAEGLALSLSLHPVYVATAHVWDEEFRERVKRHQARRGPEWTNIEEEKQLSRHALKAEFDAFTAHDATYIFVTNEIGMGGVSENAVQRKFTDLQGWMNQYVASQADEVILMVSGIAVKIKDQKIRK